MDKQDELAAVILKAFCDWGRQDAASMSEPIAAAVRSYLGSDEVVERIAEAICDHTREMHRYEDLDAHNRRFWQEHARAALSALGTDIGGGRG